MPPLSFPSCGSQLGDWPSAGAPSNKGAAAAEAAAAATAPPPPQHPSRGLAGVPSSGLSSAAATVTPADRAMEALLGYACHTLHLVACDFWKLQTTGSGATEAQLQLTHSNGALPHDRMKWGGAVGWSGG